MKITGIVRRVDDLGRIVIPKEISRQYDIREGTPMEIFTSDKGIFIQKYNEDLDLSEKIKDLEEVFNKTHNNYPEDIAYRIEKQIAALKELLR